MESVCVVIFGVPRCCVKESLSVRDFRIKTAVLAVEYDGHHDQSS